MKHCFLHRALVLLSMVLAFAATAQTTYVVSVGIERYKYSSICPPLNCSVADARAMSNFFYNYNGSKVFMLLNENATRSHILSVLKKQFSKAKPEDEIIFVYSGHGTKGGLSTYDTRNLATMVTYDDVQSIMKSSRAKRKVIIADACYSGGLTLSGTRTGGGKRRQNVNSTQVMICTSSRPNEMSLESESMTNSFFMESVLKAFNGSADANNDGKVTARELFNYVSERVVGYSMGRQHPQIWGRFDDNMVIVKLK